MLRRIACWQRLLTSHDRVRSHRRVVRVHLALHHARNPLWKTIRHATYACYTLQSRHGFRVSGAVVISAHICTEHTLASTSSNPFSFATYFAFVHRSVNSHTLIALRSLYPTVAISQCLYTLSRTTRPFAPQYRRTNTVVSTSRLGRWKKTGL